MTLYFIGLGLGSIENITLKADKILKGCHSIYFENYTSIYSDFNFEKFKERYNNAKVVLADRNLVECSSDLIINDGIENDCAFLVVGDVFCATTHSDLFLRAREKSVKVIVEHNASIFNAISACGLQLYKFGQAVSVPFFEKNWKPTSYVDKILVNFNNGFHTLVLLDIKVKEQTVENIIKRNNIFEKPRFMTIANCINQFNETELFNKLPKNIKIIGTARIGCEDQDIKYGEPEKLLNYDFGKPLHSIVIPAANLDPIEIEFLKIFEI